MSESAGAIGAISLAFMLVALLVFGLLIWVGYVAVDELYNWAKARRKRNVASVQ